MYNCLKIAFLNKLQAIRDNLGHARLVFLTGGIWLDFECPHEQEKKDEPSERVGRESEQRDALVELDLKRRSYGGH